MGRGYNACMDEPGVYLVKTARQLRELSSPARIAVVEAMLGRGATDAGEIARATGMSAETVRYHLGRLAGIGLVREAGVRKTGARPGRLYELTAGRVELAPDGRGPAFRRELARGGRLMLRLAEREFERAVQRSDGHEPLLSRTLGWLTEEEQEEVRAKVQELEAYLRERGKGPASGRHAFALTVVGTPVEGAGRGAPSA